MFREIKSASEEPANKSAGGSKQRGLRGKLYACSRRAGVVVGFASA
jgi:hypothetical protein